jgi:predicted Zn-dependent protease with MMP-like domain/Flp pilus assembly protein TadD
MRCSLVIVALTLCGCTCTIPPAAPVDAGACVCVAEVAASHPPPKSTARQEPTAATPHVQPLALCDGKGKLPLDAAREAFDAREYEKALSCAAQAAALSPGDVLAHTERANALAQLLRNDEAVLAYARALAIDPDSLDALAGAAHFYIVLMPSSRELDELGSAYAERGFELATSQRDEPFALSFARLSAMGFNDTGQPHDALDRADWVLQKEKDDPEALYERAVALFELCRFGDAKVAFTRLLGDQERAAWAHHHLGLLLEREGKEKDAEAHFGRARALDLESFPAPVLLSKDEFQAELDKALAALPADMRKDLKGVPVAMEDLPDVADLTSGEPPLSPNILGLFRGTPLGETCEPEPDAKPGTPCRSIALYRKNLARAVKTKEELVEQIGVTLLHEVGHLRGEDDSELAARGLE